MSSHPRLVRVSIFAATAFVMCLAGVTAPAQIKTEIVEKYRAELRKQAGQLAGAPASDAIGASRHAG